MNYIINHSLFCTILTETKYNIETPYDNTLPLEVRHVTECNILLIIMYKYFMLFINKTTTYGS